MLGGFGTRSAFSLLRSSAIVLAATAVLAATLSIPAEWYTVDSEPFGNYDVSFHSDHMLGSYPQDDVMVAYSDDEDGHGYWVGVLMDMELTAIGVWLVTSWLFIAATAFGRRLVSFALSWCPAIIGIIAVVFFAVEIVSAVNASRTPTFGAIPLLEGFSGSSEVGVATLGTLVHGPSDGWYALLLACLLQISAAVLITFDSRDMYTPKVKLEMPSQTPAEKRT